MEPNISCLICVVNILLIINYSIVYLKNTNMIKATNIIYKTVVLQLTTIQMKAFRIYLKIFGDKPTYTRHAVWLSP